MTNQQHLFPHVASERITDSPLHKANQFRIAGKGAVQELQPSGRGGSEAKGDFYIVGK